MSSLCGRMGCGGPVLLRSIWPTRRAGAIDGYWEFNLNPWDMAAGFLLVEEAGGMVTRFDGAYRRLDSLEILASNQRIHHELLGFFKDMFAGRDLAPLPSPAEYARAADAQPARLRHRHGSAKSLFARPRSYRAVGTTSDAWRICGVPDRCQPAPSLVLLWAS